MTDLLVHALRENEIFATNNEWRVLVCGTAANRIEQLEGILQRAVDAYDKAYCLDEVDFSWLDDARPALEVKK